jgi:hypothetical protein
MQQNFQHPLNLRNNTLREFLKSHFTTVAKEKKEEKHGKKYPVFTKSKIKQ